MRIKDIYLLPIEAQSQVLYDHGVFIGKRKVLGKVHVLFQVDGFYVEVVYSSYRQIIDQINYSLSLDAVEPYLQEMDIEILVSETL